LNRGRPGRRTGQTRFRAGQPISSPAPSGLATHPFAVRAGRVANSIRRSGERTRHRAALRRQPLVALFLESLGEAGPTTASCRGRGPCRSRCTTRCWRWCSGCSVGMRADPGRTGRDRHSTIEVDPATRSMVRRAHGAGPAKRRWVSRPDQRGRSIETPVRSSLPLSIPAMPFVRGARGDPSRSQRRTAKSSTWRERRRRRTATRAVTRKRSLCASMLHLGESDRRACSQYPCCADTATRPKGCRVCNSRARGLLGHRSAGIDAACGPGPARLRPNPRPPSIRRTWLRGPENFARHYLIQVPTYDLAPVMRTLRGAGAPRASASPRLSWLVIDDRPHSGPARRLAHRHGQPSLPRYPTIHFQAHRRPAIAPP
jgi:hypothetical protein